jgi:hypothetical protein
LQQQQQHAENHHHCLGLSVPSICSGHDPCTRAPPRTQPPPQIAPHHRFSTSSPVPVLDSFCMGMCVCVCVCVCVRTEGRRRVCPRDELKGKHTDVNTCIDGEMNVCVLGEGGGYILSHNKTRCRHKSVRGSANTHSRKFTSSMAHIHGTRIHTQCSQHSVHPAHQTPRLCFTYQRMCSLLRREKFVKSDEFGFPGCFRTFEHFLHNNKPSQQVRVAFLSYFLSNHTCMYCSNKRERQAS